MRTLVPALTALLIAGCSRNIQNQEAVRQGVIDAVASKVNLAAMDVSITAVTFKGKEADAMVDFRAKGAAPGTGMQMRYTLENKSGKWVVKQKSDSGGGNPHGAGAPAGGSPQMPTGHPPVDPAQPQPKQ